MKQILLALFLTIAPFHLGTSAEAPQAANTVPAVKDCVGPSFNGDAISIQNICPQTVEATWFFGTGHQGFATLAPKARVPTGVNAGEIPELGALRFFACPTDHPAFLTPDGGFLTEPVPTHICGTAHANFTGTTPRTFKYDVLTSGDCVLEKGSLTFTSSGQGKWEARIHTNHTTNRDIWHVNFTVLDGAGHQLFPVSPGDSPNMYGSPSPVIPWAIQFNFDAAHFADIQNVQIATSC
jgi:hypothetical protein